MTSDVVFLGSSGTSGKTETYGSLRVRGLTLCRLFRKAKKMGNTGFLAQAVDTTENNNQSSQQISILNPWKSPPVDWHKCNCGVSWSKKKKIVGGAWVLRDHRGKVLLHSRRAFANVVTIEEANFLVAAWCVESMSSHHVDNIIFGSQDFGLIGAVVRPSAWPSFLYQSSELTRALQRFSSWRLHHETAATNRGASLIAQISVSSDFRTQSYVASGHPTWLSDIFDFESDLASL